jgi:hypothetical protein
MFEMANIGEKVCLHISTIYKSSLGYESDLYGRRTAELEEKPLKE